MKNTKRFIALMMAITLIIMAFAACSTKKPAEPETTKPVAENPTKSEQSTKESPTKSGDKETEVAPIEPTESEPSTKESPTESGKKPTEAPKPTKSVAEVAKDVLAGKYGSGEERKAKLKAEGYDPEEVQAEINKQSAQTEPKATEQSKPKTTEVSKPKTTEASKPKTTEAPKPKKESKPTENQYAYYKASTGESIQYCTYNVNHGKSTVSESGGVFRVKYADGFVAEEYKCSNCGKYLCEGGCQPETEYRCSICGRKDCHQFISDTECPYCGKFVKKDTCHYCK